MMNSNLSRGNLFILLYFIYPLFLKEQSTVLLEGITVHSTS